MEQKNYINSSNEASYSNLMADIQQGRIHSLTLIPSRREVIAKYVNGDNKRISILKNDQLILRTAQENSIPLTVKDLRKEQAIASLTGNLTFILIIIVGLIFLFRRTNNIASRTMGFGKTQARINPEIDLDIRFEDVQGVSEATEELKEVVSFLKAPETLKRLGAKAPKGVLLVGPPGTGKTLLAKAIAGESQVPFFSISASEFVELFVGVGASRVRDLFNKAKNQKPCIVFIDEIDAIGRQRGSGIGGGNDEREQTLNQLLTEMDGFGENSGVIVLAATNRPDVLDSALIRPGRFDRTIQVLLPDKKGREKILSVHARTRPLSEEVNLNDWALRTPGFSGAQLANLLNESAIIAARNNQNLISSKDIEIALERITMGLTRKSPLDRSKLRLIAYHEIGHALVAALLPDADKVDKISILPRAGGVGGFTRFWPDEEIIDSGLISRKYLFSRLVVALGGRAAEIIVFGSEEVTQGASGDLENVQVLARDMVTKYGFSSMGPISLSQDRQQVFLGRDLISSKSTYGEATAREIDLQVRKLAFEAMDMAIELLKPNIDQMDLLVDALIEEETLSSEKFIEIAGLSDKRN